MSRIPPLICAALFLHLPGVGMRADAADAAKAHVFFLIGESEYDTKTTLPAFARAELEPRGIRCAFSILPDNAANEFPGLDALKDADLLFISVRRHTPPKAQMDAIRAHVAAGKPVAGIRTASHAFALTGDNVKVPEGHADWPEFDRDVIGGNYRGHYGVGIATFGKINPDAAGNPVLTGIAAGEFNVPSHLYRNPDLPAFLNVLMTARMEGRPEVEPIAWLNPSGGRRVFYTSLGSPEDFAVPQFRRLLLNGIHWALGLPMPAVK